MSGTVITAPPHHHEPDHGCITRLCLFPLGILSLGAAGAACIFNLIATPVMFVGLICCKIGICKGCCPQNIQIYSKSVICTPCRWIRAGCTGKGHLGCCCEGSHPQWPDFKELITSTSQPDGKTVTNPII